MKNTVGAVVTGDRFWDREVDRKLFIEKIMEGSHILLSAQRRMGKTSLLEEVAEEIKDTHTCLFVDLQKCKSSSDAITELSVVIHKYKNLWTKVKDVFSNIANMVEKVDFKDIGVTLRSGLNEGNWSIKGDQLFDILSACGERVVLMFDEMPIMLNRILKEDNTKISKEGKSRADEFMSWLRKNSTKHQGKLNIVISGSIGLEPILRQAGLSSTINNFTPFELKPWEDSTAIGCLKALAREYKVKFEDGAPEKMIKLLGCNIPHHVQLFFQLVHDNYVRRKNMACTARDVETVYKSDMLSVRGHVELTHYEERLEQVLGKEKTALAFEMLCEAAITGKLSKDAILSFQKYYTFSEETTIEVQNEILLLLEHDGYLRKKGDSYIFISRLLKDWWKNRHKNFYVPVLERRG
jgi:hypothetical protein